jgi:hypothetical protein
MTVVKRRRSRGEQASALEEAGVSIFLFRVCVCVSGGV